MEVLRDIETFRRARARLQGDIAFVPTMGALHRGHLSLMELGLRHADHLVVSIFVNPTQFDREEDLTSYPRDEDSDLRACRDVGASLVFIPDADVMYPDGPGQATTVSVGGLTDNLCGRTRPGHFDGVTTVVSKLFNVIRPDLAVFGQKDYQQLAVIRRMVSDLNFPVRIIAGPTARESDGLAISSRNLNLDTEGRRRGVALSRGLREAHALFREGERNAKVLERTAKTVLENAGVEVDYVECVHPDNLDRLDEVGSDGAVLALAGFAGDVRLIDNVRLDRELPPGMR